MRHKLSNLARIAATVLALEAASCASLSPVDGGLDALADGDEARAEKLFRKAIKRGRDVHQARFQLEKLLMSRAERLSDEDPAAAIAVMREILELNPSSTQARVALGRALLRSEDYVGALAVLDAEGCAGCKSLSAVVYERRAVSLARSGDFTEAAEDFERAFAMRRDPLLLLTKAEIYAKVGGDIADAAESIKRAAAVIETTNPSHLTRFVEVRLLVAPAAAKQGEHEAVEKVLAIQNPKWDFDGERAIREDFALRLAVARAELDAGALDEGMRRGAAVYQEARAGEDDELKTWAKAQLLELFVRRASLEIGAGSRSALKTVKAGLRLDRKHEVLRAQRVLAMAIRSPKRAKSLVKQFDRDSNTYKRLQATLLTMRAQRLLDIGQLTAARSAVERAEEVAPGLFEVRLAAAEVSAASRLEGLTKTAAQDFRRIGAFKYPEGRINRYGEALATLAWVRKYYDEGVKNDPLRGPQFHTRLEQLEQNIRAFYPYDVAFNPDPTAVLVLQRGANDPVEVKVDASRRRAQTVSLPGAGNATLTFEHPGFVRLETADRELGLFVEHYASITAVI